MLRQAARCNGGQRCGDRRCDERWCDARRCGDKRCDERRCDARRCGDRGAMRGGVMRGGRCGDRGAMRGGVMRGGVMRSGVCQLSKPGFPMRRQGWEAGRHLRCSGRGLVDSE